ncbi:hypothetical protein, partial [Actinotignum sp. GS-2025c]|uniref:hypothetical protein n=1 Tax=Actinotignum sp. GS-2025c TaxID=3427276 RepID=UPI003F456646
SHPAAGGCGRAYRVTAKVALNEPSQAVHVPAAVEFEIYDTPKRRPQFKRAAETWLRLPGRFKSIISDAPTEDLRQCCRDVLGVEFDDMYSHTKDRGENMAILHGVLLARSGKKVVLVCDEENGTFLIKKQARLLMIQHQRGLHVPGGAIAHATTITLLQWAIERGGFKNRAEFIKKYHAMASLDEALPKDIKATGLTKSPPWPGESRSDDPQ